MGDLLWWKPSPVNDRTSVGLVARRITRAHEAVAEVAVLTGLRTANVRKLNWTQVGLERAHAWRLVTRSTHCSSSRGMTVHDRWQTP